MFIAAENIVRKRKFLMLAYIYTVGGIFSLTPSISAFFYKLSSKKDI